jgi:dolichyl-phosphate-mannose--protein O-mannosyl transferase
VRLLAYSLPEDISPEAMRHFLITLGLLCIVSAVLAVRFIGKLVVRAWLAVALVLLGFVLFVQRAQLADCAQSCSCEVFSLAVQVPGCQPQ